MTPVASRGHHRQHVSIPTRDPLTTIFIFTIYPIFFFLFLLLHALYHLFLKLIASIQWQRYIYSEARQRPKQLFKTWRDGLGLKKAGVHTAQKASEERLLKRGNRIRCKGRLEVDQVAKKQKMLAPRHLALVLASKPVRMRVLLYRAFVSLFRGGKGRDITRRERKLEEEGQKKFALESVEIALKCCALTGVEEISIYDEAGRIKEELMSKGQQEWNLEWQLEQEWEGPNDEEVPGYEYQTPRSDSFSSNTPSFTSALESTPTLSTRPSSTSLRNLNDYDNLPLLFSSNSPRLRLSAALHTPFRSIDATLKGNVRSKNSGFSSLDNNISLAKIKVNILGTDDGKEALAKAASTLVAWDKRPKTVDVKTIDGVLQSHGYPSEPDLLIIHGGPRRVRTLHGFPPWLVRLCEIYYDQNASPYHSFTSSSFEGAIASFSRSEQRYGK